MIRLHISSRALGHGSRSSLAVVIGISIDLLARATIIHKMENTAQVQAKKQHVHGLILLRWWNISATFTLVSATCLYLILVILLVLALVLLSALLLKNPEPKP